MDTRQEDMGCSPRLPLKFLAALSLLWTRSHLHRRPFCDLFLINSGVLHLDFQIFSTEKGFYQSPMRNLNLGGKGEPRLCVYLHTIFQVWGTRSHRSKRNVKYHNNYAKFGQLDCGFAHEVLSLQENKSVIWKWQGRNGMELSTSNAWNDSY